MSISASCTRSLRLFSVLSGAAGVVLVLGAASRSPVADTPAQAAVVAGARVTASGGSWGRPAKVAAALNAGGGAEIESVSCPSAGDCGAGGYYTDSSGNIEAFVVSEVNGTWRPAAEVAAALNTLGVGEINSVSCGSAGNCTAGGYYSNSRLQAAFVVNETNGTWGKAREVAAALNTGGSARIESVACPSAGDCTAGGYYTDKSGHQQAFAVSEANGTWGAPAEVAAALNSRANAGINSVSCPSAGNCTAAGYYNNNLNGMHGHSYAFVVNEMRGTWGQGKEIAAALNTIGQALIYSVSCGSAGNCSAGGYYTSASGRQPFAVDQAGGTWRPAAKVAGVSGTGGGAGVYSVSCPSAGNCSAGGYYTLRSGQGAFVVTKANGTWGTAAEVAAALNTGKYAWLYSVSCTAPGDCSAGGIYTSNGQQAFVVNQANGTWRPAAKVAAALNTGGDAAINSVSCTAAGYCGAGGYYTDSSGQQAFVISKP